MLNLSFRLRFALVFVVATGCSGNVPPPPVSDSGPLTVEEWRQINPNERYDAIYIERLRQSDPKLRTKKGWREFVNTEAERNKKMEMAKSAEK